MSSKDSLSFIYYIYNFLQTTCNEICISKQYVFLLHSFTTSTLNMVIPSDWYTASKIKEKGKFYLKEQVQQTEAIA